MQMNKEILFFILLGACVLFSCFYQKRVQENLLKKLYQYKREHNEKAFMDALDSTYTKIVFSKFTLEFMKLNYYLDHHAYQKAKEQFKKFQQMKLKNRNFLALNLRMFNGALEAKDYSLASALKEAILPILKKQTDSNSKILYGELIQLDKIYIQKDVSIINDLLEAYDACEDDKIKSLLCFRIAKLYHYMGNAEKVNDYLKLAEEYTEIHENKLSLEALIKDHRGLD